MRVTPRTWLLQLVLAGAAISGLADCSKKPSSRPLSPLPAPVTLPSGLTYQLLAEGDGAAAAPGNKVKVHYTGWLVNGTKFDSSLDRDQPFTFRLGAGQVVKGWDEGIAGMKLGEKRKLTVPPDLGYGSQSVGPIPENATLVFEIELLDAF